MCAPAQPGVLSVDLGGIATTYHPNHGLAFRNSGAQALLSPWRVRHAGVIE